METERRRVLAHLLACTALAPVGACSLVSGTEMKPSDSSAALHQFLAAQSIDTSSLIAAQLVSSSIGFYRNVRCADLAAEANADMLLVQWGVFDWGKGAFFEFDITRQFIRSGAAGDDAISQLHFTAYYAPTEELGAIPSENHWCRSLADADSFESFVLSSVAFKAVKSLPPLQVAIEWGYV